MPKAVPIETEDVDFHQTVTPQERTKALIAIGVPQDKAENPALTLEQKLDTQHDNSAMLGDSTGKGKKKKTVTERVNELFRQKNFSPTTDLVNLVKVERAKFEAYTRAEISGMSEELLACLPKPDKKFYAALLMTLAKYEVPEYKSVEISGHVEAGMTVQVIHTAPQQKVIRIDGGSPEKLKKIYGMDNTKTIDVESAITKVALEDDI